MNDSTPTPVTDLDAHRAAAPAPKARRGRRTLLAVALAGGLAVGGAGVAAAAQGASPSASSSAAASAPAAPAAPADGQAPPAPADGQTPPAPPAPGEGPAADGEATARQPHLDGTVVSVSDGSFTIQDRDGFTRTIATTGDTTYASAPEAPAAPTAGEDGAAPSEPAAPASASRGDVLTEGARIHATGTVASDGTTLDATEVGLAPEPPAGGPQGGPAGPAGPGGGRDGGPRGDRAEAPQGASGAPSAPAAPQGEEQAPSGS